MPRSRQDGQALILAALALVILLGFAGLVIDIGRVYVAQRQLQQAVDAATLAAAQDLPTQADAIATIQEYSAAPGQRNAHPGVTASLPDVGSGITFKCLSSTGISCQNDTGQCNCNAVKVSESATVNTTLLGLFGVKSFTSVSASAVASMRGGVPHPLDVEVIVDTTSSMSDNCTDSSNHQYYPVGMSSGGGFNPFRASKLDCAKEGVRSLLGVLLPCPQTQANCGTVDNTGNVVNATDKVGFVTFPGLNSGVSSAPEFDCSWTLSKSSTGYSNANGYGIVGLQSDYRSDPNSATLNTASKLVKANWWSTCPGGNWTTTVGSKYGAEAPSCTQACTFYADAITYAYKAIAAEQQANPNRQAQGVIILLSDGDANDPTQGSDQCHRAIDAAQTAASDPYNDWVFSIAYDSTTSGCSTDTSQNERQTVTTNVSTGGYFTLTANGHTTGNINWAAPATGTGSVQTALQSVLGNGTVSVTRTTHGFFFNVYYTYTVTFTGSLANTDIPQMTYSNHLTGGTHTIAIATIQDGSNNSISPFQTMADIASDPSYFYCFHPPTNTPSCTSAANVAAVFNSVGVAVTSPRLLDDGVQ